MREREPSAEAIALIASAIRNSLPPGTSAAEVERIKVQHGRAIAEELEREIQKRRLQSQLLVAPSKGLAVLLRAAPNPDFRPDTHEATVRVSGRWFPVASLLEAQEVVRTFLWAWNLGGGNWTGGTLARDGRDFARISYNTRLWDLAGKELFLPGGLDYTAQAFPGARDPDGPAPELEGKLAQLGLVDRAEPKDAPGTKKRSTSKAQAPRTRKSKQSAEAKPVSFSTRRQKVRPEVKEAIDAEIAALKASEKPDALVASFSDLSPRSLQAALIKAGRKKIGSVVEFVRRIQRERSDLSQALQASIDSHGTLNEHGNAIQIGSGISMGLALVRPEVARILWAARYLSAMGEL